ncbi:hypothetical protein DFJ74DRAFT_287982 [Hyaloraphidium curvatum]|nr:hypothetical protein DFJ74DRAFT_287982 [Hyaloraphidium curvatum]
MGSLAAMHSSCYGAGWVGTGRRRNSEIRSVRSSASAQLPALRIGQTRTLISPPSIDTHDDGQAARLAHRSRGARRRRRGCPRRRGHDEGPLCPLLRRVFGVQLLRVRLPRRPGRQRRLHRRAGRPRPVPPLRTAGAYLHLWRRRRRPGHHHQVVGRCHTGSDLAGRPLLARRRLPRRRGRADPRAAVRRDRRQPELHDVPHGHGAVPAHELLDRPEHRPGRPVHQHHQLLAQPRAAHFGRGRVADLQPDGAGGLHACEPQLLGLRTGGPHQELHHRGRFAPLGRRVKAKGTGAIGIDEESSRRLHL